MMGLNPYLCRHVLVCPLFSIITVCFKALEALTETRSSIEGQTWTDYEHIVIDGEVRTVRQNGWICSLTTA